MSIHHFSCIRISVSAAMLLVLGVSGCVERQYPSTEGAPDGIVEFLKVSSDEPSEIHPTEVPFLTLVNQPDRILLVDFWAPWCGPCRHLAPELEKVARQYPDKVSVVKVDIQSAANVDLARFFDIRTIPELRIFVRGQSAGAIQGYVSASRIVRRLQPAMKQLDRLAGS